MFVKEYKTPVILKHRKCWDQIHFLYIMDSSQTGRSVYQKRGNYKRFIHNMGQHKRKLSRGWVRKSQLRYAHGNYLHFQHHNF